MQSQCVQNKKIPHISIAKDNPGQVEEDLLHGIQITDCMASFLLADIDQTLAVRVVSKTNLSLEYLKWVHMIIIKAFVFPKFFISSALTDQTSQA